MNLDKLRAKQAHLAGAMQKRDGDAPLAAEQKPVKPAGKPKQKQPEIVGSEMQAASCGHLVKLNLHAKEPYLDARRKKITDKACSVCRQKAHLEREAAARAAKQQKQAAKAGEADDPANPERLTGRHKLHGRLPNMARFEVTYHSADQRWAGSLTIPEAAGPGVPLHIEGSAGALFALLKRLDADYRKCLVPGEEIP